MSRFSSFSVDYDDKFRLEGNKIIKTADIEEIVCVLSSFEFYDPDDKDMFMFVFSKDGSKKKIPATIRYFELTINGVNDVSIGLSCNGKTYGVCFK